MRRRRKDEEEEEKKKEKVKCDVVRSEWKRLDKEGEKKGMRKEKEESERKERNEN